MAEIKKMYSTRNEGDYPQNLNLKLEKEDDLRYGENPNQPGALYKTDAMGIAKLTGIKLLKSGKGGMSATNMLDVTRAIDILKFFEKPSCAVMKHTIPSGFATQFNDNNLADIYSNARDADARAAFGSIVVFNCTLDKKTAEKIVASFVEGVAAPEYEEEAIDILSAKKNLRIIKFSNIHKIPKFEGDETSGLYDIKAMPTGRILVQKPFLTKVKKDTIILHAVSDEIAVKKTPAKQEIDDLMTAWYVNIGTRSNGVVIVKNGITLAIGTGQQERVGAVEQSIIKAYQKALDREGIGYDSLNVMASAPKLSKNPLDGASISSDGFFPFRDSIDIIAKQGIKAIIQPGGSIKDKEVIEAANEHGLSMIFTNERCFGHF